MWEGDPDAIEWERGNRRRWLMSLIQGWLRVDRMPRLTIVGILVLCFIAGVVIDQCLLRAGVELRSFRWLSAVIVAWPIFAVGLRWRAGVEWAGIDIDRLSHELASSGEDPDERPAPLPSGRRNTWRDGVGAGIRGGSQGGGGMTLPVFLFIGAVTLGGWLVWDLIRRGPSLLANCIIDSEIGRSRLEVVTRIPLRNWWIEALGSTAAHFAGLAVAAFVLGLPWPWSYLR